MMTRDEEARVIRAVLDGDTDRFEDLVHAYEKGIYNLCLRMLNDEQDAMDAAQEAFFKAFRSLPSFRGESRFSTWLYRLAGNVCLDMLRRRPNAPVLSMNDDDVPLILADASASPQEIVERRETRQTVRAALAALPEDFRQAVILRDVNGLSYEEIADVTGLELGTVKSRIYRARKKLAAVLLGGNISAPSTSNRTDNRRRKGGARV